MYVARFFMCYSFRAVVAATMDVGGGSKIDRSPSPGGLADKRAALLAGLGTGGFPMFGGQRPKREEKEQKGEETGRLVLSLFFFCMKPCHRFLFWRHSLSYLGPVNTGSVATVFTSI